MTSGRIASYREQGHIASAAPESILPVAPIHSAWRNFVSQASVRALAAAPNSMGLWLSTWGGILAWDRQAYRRYSSEHGLAGNGAHTLCVDAEGRVWAGSEGGLCVFTDERWSVYESTQLNGQQVRALASAGAPGGIWAATAEAVYAIANPQAVAVPVVHATHLAGVNAQCLLADGDGLLLGNAHGLYRLCPGMEPVRLHAGAIDNCVALARDGQDRVWAATLHALHRLDGDAVQPMLPVEPVGEIVAIAAAIRRIWVLTTTALAFVENGQWTPVATFDDGAGAPIVRDILPAGDDFYLWAGCEDERLLGMYAVTGSAARWDRNYLPPHPDDKLSNLLTCLGDPFDDGNVWVGSTSGLCKVDATGSSESLAENVHVRSFCVDGEGAFWMLSWPAGVQCGDPRRAVPELPGLPERLQTGLNGQVHVLTGRGLWRLDGDRWAPITLPPPAAVHALAQTADGHWWLGTEEGVFEQWEGTWRYRGEQPGPLNSAVTGLMAAGETLWAAGEAGLWRRTQAGWEAHSPQVDKTAIPVWRLAAGAGGTLWLACADGVRCYDPVARHVEQHYTPANSGLASLRIVDLLATQTHLWIATQSGLSCLALDDDL